MEFKVILRFLLEKWWIVFSAVFITVGIALVYTFNVTPKYSATVTYVVSPSPELMDENSFVGGLSVLSGQTTITNTYTSIATSPVIRKNAITALELTQQQNNSLDVRGRVRSGTNMIDITVEGSDPFTVQAFANRIGRSTEEYVDALYKVYGMNLLDSAKSPEKPIWPNIPLNLVLAFTLGIVLGGGIVLVTSMKEF